MAGLGPNGTYFMKLMDVMNKMCRLEVGEARVVLRQYYPKYNVFEVPDEWEGQRSFTIVDHLGQTKGHYQWSTRFTHRIEV